jgi:hypothetical protein
VRFSLTVPSEWLKEAVDESKHFGYRRRRMPNRAFIGIGTNLGYRAWNYQQAILRIAALPETSVQPFPTNRADKPLDLSVLQRERAATGMIVDTHRTNAPLVGRTEDAIPVTNEMTRLLPREGFSDFPGDPLDRRIAGHRDPDQPSSRVSKNHQGRSPNV